MIGRLQSAGINRAVATHAGPHHRVLIPADAHAIYPPGYAMEAADRLVSERVAEIAGRHEVPMARVALAWVRQKPGVTAPIIGASKIGQLEDLVAALEVKLTAEEVAYLEEPYVPHAVAGHS